MAKGNVWVIGSHKGGVGKSTLAINLAGAIKAHLPDDTVKLIDSDIGKSTTRWHESRVNYSNFLVENGHPALPEIMFDYFDFNKSMAQKIQGERKLIDHIIVDTGGFAVENLAFESAYLAASAVYIPFTPDKFDLISLVPTLHSVRALEQRLSDQINSAGGSYTDRDVRILMNKADRARGREGIITARGLVDGLRDLCAISSVEVPLLKGFKDSTDEGLTVYEVMTDSARKAQASIDLLFQELTGSRPLKKYRFE